MKKIANMLTQCIFVIYALLWIGIVILDLFYSSINYSCKKVFLFSNMQLLLIGGLAMVCTGAISCLLSKKICIKWEKININALSIALFVVQVYIFYNIYFQMVGWDPGVVYRNAEMISRGDSTGLMHDYFSMYPNNQGIVCLQAIMIWLNRIFGVWDSEGFFFMIVVQCFLTSATGKILYDNLRLLNCSKKYAMIGWILYVILIGLSGWNVVSYTDMMGLIFPIAIFRLYLSLKNEKRNIVKWVGIITLAFWGAKIKPTVLIILIALVINEIINFGCNFDYHQALRGKFKTLTQIAIAGCICVFLFSSLFAVAIRSTGLIIDKEADMGVLHWMMMGLNPVNDGVYYDDDVQLSHGIEDKSERTRVQINKIQERLKDYGFKGFVKHMGRKSLIIFNDGSFAWGVEGGFYDGRIYPDKNSVVSPFLRSLYYNDGSRYSYLSTTEQFAWIMVLFNSIGIIAVKRRKEIITIVLALIGIIMFNLTFEARARYIILYVPFFIMAAIIALQNCEMRLRAKLKGKDLETAKK